MAYRTGPYTKNLVTPDLIDKRTWYRTVPKRSLPCYYNKLWSRAVQRQGTKFYATLNVGSVSSYLFASRFYSDSSNLLALVNKRSYDKFISQVSDKADFLLLLAERREAVSTVVEGCTRLYKVWRDISRGRFRSAFDRIGITLSKSDRGKTASHLWLQYHYGWVPTVNDVAGAIEALESPFPYAKIRGSASFPRKTFKVFSDGGSYTGWRQYKEDTIVLRVAFVGISNPGLYQATELGFTNPASFLWEKVPFSFVIDWWVPIGDFLNSYTDLLGLEIKDATTTTLYKCEGCDYYWSSSTTPKLNVLHTKAFHMRRELGLLSPFAYGWPIGSLNVSRAANAVALMRTVFNDRSGARVFS